MPEDNKKHSAISFFKQAYKREKAGQNKSVVSVKSSGRRKSYYVERNSSGEVVGATEKEYAEQKAKEQQTVKQEQATPELAAREKETPAQFFKREYRAEQKRRTILLSNSKTGRTMRARRNDPKDVRSIKTSRGQTGQTDNKPVFNPYLSYAQKHGITSDDAGGITPIYNNEGLIVGVEDDFLKTSYATEQGTHIPAVNFKVYKQTVAAIQDIDYKARGIPTKSDPNKYGVVAIGEAKLDKSSLAGGMVPIRNFQYKLHKKAQAAGGIKLHVYEAASFATGFLSQVGNWGVMLEQAATRENLMRTFNPYLALKESKTQAEIIGEKTKENRFDVVSNNLLQQMFREAEARPGAFLGEIAASILIPRGISSGIQKLKTRTRVTSFKQSYKVGRVMDKDKGLTQSKFSNIKQEIAINSKHKFTYTGKGRTVTQQIDDFAVERGVFSFKQDFRFKQPGGKTKPVNMVTRSEISKLKGGGMKADTVVGVTSSKYLSRAKDQLMTVDTRLSPLYSKNGLDTIKVTSMGKSNINFKNVDYIQTGILKEHASITTTTPALTVDTASYRGVGGVSKNILGKYFKSSLKQSRPKVSHFSRLKEAVSSKFTKTQGVSSQSSELLLSPSSASISSAGLALIQKAKTQTVAKLAPAAQKTASLFKTVTGGTATASFIKTSRSFKTTSLNSDHSLTQRGRVKPPQLSESSRVLTSITGGVTKQRQMPTTFLSSNTKSKTTNRQKISSRISQSSIKNTSSSLRNSTRTFQTPRSNVITSTRTSTSVKLATRAATSIRLSHAFRTYTGHSNPAAIPPPFIPFPSMFPDLDIKSLKNKRRRSSGKFRSLRSNYAPSLGAVLFNIKSSKVPKIITGLEVRPIKI